MSAIHILAVAAFVLSSSAANGTTHTDKPMAGFVGGYLLGDAAKLAALADKADSLPITRLYLA